MKGLHSGGYDRQQSASPLLAHPSTLSQRSNQGQHCDRVCHCSALCLMLLIPKALDKERLLRQREQGSPLLQEVPLYPGAHTHVPSSGEQEPPF